MDNNRKLEALRELPEDETGINWELYEKIKQARKPKVVVPVPETGKWFKKEDILKEVPHLSKTINALYPDEFWLRYNAVQVLVGTFETLNLKSEIHTNDK